MSMRVSDSIVLGVSFSVTFPQPTLKAVATEMPKLSPKVEKPAQKRTVKVNRETTVVIAHFCLMNRFGRTCLIQHVETVDFQRVSSK